MQNTPIDRQYSSQLDFLHAILQFLVIAALCYGWRLTVLPSYLFLLMTGYILYSGYQFRQQQICLKSKQSIAALVIPTVGSEWQLIETNGLVQIGHLLGDSILLPWVLLLHFKVIGGRRQFLILTASSVGRCDFKRLQRRLRFCKE